MSFSGSLPPLQTRLDWPVEGIQTWKTASSFELSGASQAQDALEHINLWTIANGGGYAPQGLGCHTTLSCQQMMNTPAPRISLGQRDRCAEGVRGMGLPGEAPLSPAKATLPKVKPLLQPGWPLCPGKSSLLCHTMPPPLLMNEQCLLKSPHFIS